nr:unnamed protein product [Callosobruchus chinensis]
MSLSRAAERRRFPAIFAAVVALPLLMGGTARGQQPVLPFFEPGVGGDLSFFGEAYSLLFPVAKTATPEVLVPAASHHGRWAQGYIPPVPVVQQNHIDVGQQMQKDYYAKLDKAARRGYNKGQYVDEALDKGNEDHVDEAGYEVDSGKKDKYLDEALHYKKQLEGRKGVKTAKFGEKKGHRRGHKTKGYHNKFHKDEYHKEHRFYDDVKKSGHHSKFGNFRSKYGKKEGGRRQGGRHKSGYHGDAYGKKGFSDKGHLDEEHKGYQRHGGREEYYKKHKDFGKQNTRVGGAVHAHQAAGKI